VGRVLGSRQGGSGQHISHQFGPGTNVLMGPVWFLGLFLDRIWSGTPKRDPKTVFRKEPTNRNRTAFKIPTTAGWKYLRSQNTSMESPYKGRILDTVVRTVVTTSDEYPNLDSRPTEILVPKQAYRVRTGSKYAVRFRPLSVWHSGWSNLWQNSGIHVHILLFVVKIRASQGLSTVSHTDVLHLGRKSPPPPQNDNVRVRSGRKFKINIWLVFLFLSEIPPIQTDPQRDPKTKDRSKLSDAPGPGPNRCKKFCPLPPPRRVQKWVSFVQWCAERECVVYWYSI